MPVSLCRSGGCTGVTTSRNGHGVNFEFNEHDDPYTLAGTASVKSSPTRRNSGNSSMLDSASVLTQGGSVVTVKATISKGILSFSIKYCKINVCLFLLAV